MMEEKSKWVCFTTSVTEKEREALTKYITNKYGVVLVRDEDSMRKFREAKAARK